MFWLRNKKIIFCYTLLTKVQQTCTLSKGMYSLCILAHSIRISDILSWVRKSYLTHAILPTAGYHVCPVHWLYWNLCDIVIKRSQCCDKVKSSSDIVHVSQRIQELLGSFVLSKKKRIQYGIEKSIPRNCLLSSLCKPCDAKW